ncbi:hypothetical protein [Halorubrum sp. Ea8]|uniref:hypothetical protein n=1 Tax=Halorubrum sp. Ea8 TaxID=1383841 RepID=UPI000B995AFC|nr:hypothetical protein [Halorubrum sp. Ea8]OYR44580.1 hypothetical protein DJ74_17450 [Halorubrum sp. Ea8]
MAHKQRAVHDRDSQSNPPPTDEIERRQYLRFGAMAVLPIFSAGRAAGATDEDPGQGVDDEHSLLIDGVGTGSTYEFTVDGHLEPGIDARADAEACISGCNAEGAVTDGSRRYRFTGNLRALSLRGEAVISLDGETIVP